MEVHIVDDEESKLSTTSGWIFKTVFVLNAIFALIMLVKDYFDDFGLAHNHPILAVVALVGYLFSLSIGWKLSNSFRRFIVPKAYVSRGSDDALKKKIHWLVGPQLSTMGVLYCVYFLLFTNLVANGDKTRGPSSNRAPAPVVATAPAPAAAPTPSPTPSPAPEPQAVASAPAATEPASAASEPAAAAVAAPASVAAPAAPVAAAAVAPAAVPAAAPPAISVKVVAPAESAALLQGILENATSAFKLAELKAQVESLPKPATGDRKAARKLNEQGLEQLKSGGVDQAVATLRSAVAQDGADVEVLNNYVFALFRAKQFPEAETQAGRLLGMSPGRSSAWANLAEIYASTNRADAAVQALIVAFQFSSNKDRTLAFLNERAADASNPVAEPAKNAIERLKRL